MFDFADLDDATEAAAAKEEEHRATEADEASEQSSAAAAAGTSSPVREPPGLEGLASDAPSQQEASSASQPLEAACSEAVGVVEAAEATAESLDAAEEAAVSAEGVGEGAATETAESATVDTGGETADDPPEDIQKPEPVAHADGTGNDAVDGQAQGGDEEAATEDTAQAAETVADAAVLVQDVGAEIAESSLTAEEDLEGAAEDAAAASGVAETADDVPAGAAAVAGSAAEDQVQDEDAVKTKVEQLRGGRWNDDWSDFYYWDDASDGYVGSEWDSELNEGKGHWKFLWHGGFAWQPEDLARHLEQVLKGSASVAEETAVDAEDAARKKVEQLNSGYWSGKDFWYWDDASNGYVTAEWDPSLNNGEGWYTFLWHEDVAWQPEQLAAHLSQNGDASPADGQESAWANTGHYDAWATNGQDDSWANSGRGYEWVSEARRKFCSSAFTGVTDDGVEAAIDQLKNTFVKTDFANLLRTDRGEETLLSRLSKQVGDYEQEAQRIESFEYELATLVSDVDKLWGSIDAAASLDQEATDVPLPEKPAVAEQAADPVPPAADEAKDADDEPSPWDDLDETIDLTYLPAASTKTAWKQDGDHWQSESSWDKWTGKAADDRNARDWGTNDSWQAEDSKRGSSGTKDSWRTEETSRAEDPIEKKIKQLREGSWTEDWKDFEYWDDRAGKYVSSEWDSSLGDKGFWKFLWHDGTGWLPELLAEHLEKNKSSGSGDWGSKDWRSADDSWKQKDFQKDDWHSQNKPAADDLWSKWSTNGQDSRERGHDVGKADTSWSGWEASSRKPVGRTMGEQEIKTKIRNLKDGAWSKNGDDFMYWDDASDNYVGCNWDESLGRKGWWQYLWHEGKGYQPEDLIQVLEDSLYDRKKQSATGSGHQENSSWGGATTSAGRAEGRHANWEATDSYRDRGGEDPRREFAGAIGARPTAGAGHYGSAARGKGAGDSHSSMPPGRGGLGAAIDAWGRDPGKGHASSSHPGYSDEGAPGRGGFGGTSGSHPGFRDDGGKGKGYLEDGAGGKGSFGTAAFSSTHPGYRDDGGGGKGMYGGVAAAGSHPGYRDDGGKGSGKGGFASAAPPGQHPVASGAPSRGFGGAPAPAGKGASSARAGMPGTEDPFFAKLDPWAVNSQLGQRREASGKQGQDNPWKHV